MSEGIKLDAIIDVVVKPRATGFDISYGPSFPGDNAPVNYGQPTTIYITDPQTGVTYKLYEGETPTPDGYIEDGTVTGNGISFNTGNLTENTTFCVEAVNESNGLSIPIEPTVAVIVKPNPGVRIAAISGIIEYGQSANIQIESSQPTAKYYIQGYALDTAVQGNNYTITLTTDPLENDGDLFVEAINLDENADTIVVVNNGDAVSVQVRPNPDVRISIPDLNEQNPGQGNAGTTYKVATVVCNRELTVQIRTPQTGVTYQLQDEQGNLVGSDSDSNGGTIIQSDSLESAVAYRVRATKAAGNYTVLTDTVQVNIEAQVVLENDFIYYKDTATVIVKATEDDKTYTLYEGSPENGTIVTAQDGNDDTANDGVISLETDPLTDYTNIYVTQQTKGGNGSDEITIAEFAVGVTDRITAESTLIPYNTSATIVVGAPENGLDYQLRSDAHNELSDSIEPYTGNGDIPLELTSDAITETTTFNVTEDGVEQSPVITVEVMPHVGPHVQAISYNTPAMIEVCDPVGAVDQYSLNDGAIAIDLDSSGVENGIIILITEPLTEEGEKEIIVHDQNGPMEDGIVMVTVGSRITAPASVFYGSQAIVEVAATADTGESGKGAYTLYNITDGTAGPSTENTYDPDTEITRLTTNASGELIATKTYEVRKDGTPIAEDFEIAVEPRITADAPIPYYTEAVIRVAATIENTDYQLYADDIAMGNPVTSSGGILELISDFLREGTTFTVSEGGPVSPAGSGIMIEANSVPVTLYPQAYAEFDEVLYNDDTATIIVTAPEMGVEYQAKDEEGNIYSWEGTPGEGEDAIISITKKLTKSTNFDVYKSPDFEEPINEEPIKISVTHQLIEKEIYIDYDGPAFIRIGASIAPEDNMYNDAPYEVVYELRRDDHNIPVAGQQKTGNGGELIFKTPNNTKDTLYNILVRNHRPDTKNEEFRVQVFRNTTPVSPVTVDIGVQDKAMVSYNDMATLSLQDPGIDKTYEILDNEGNTLTNSGKPMEGGNGNLTHSTDPLTEDTHYIARVNTIDPEGENGQLIAYLSRQTVMMGRLKFYGDDNYHFISFDSNSLLQIVDEQTIEMWVKTADPGNGEQVLYDKSRIGEGSTSINDGNGMPKYNYGDSGGELLADTALTADEWTHIAVVRDSSNVQWYINGTLHGGPSTLTGIVNVTNEGARIGAEQTADGLSFQSFFKGLLAEVRLWGVARTVEQINACRDRRLEPADMDATLVAYWKLKPGIGPVIVPYASHAQMRDHIVPDASRNQIQGTINGAIWEGEAQVIPYNSEATVVIESSVRDALYQIRDIETEDVYAEATGDGNDLEVTTIPLAKTTTLQVYKYEDIDGDYNTVIGNSTTISVLHHVIEKEIITDGIAPVNVTIGASRSGVEYQLFFANNSSEAGVPQIGTDTDTLLTISTNTNIMADTVLNIIASYEDYEEVAGTVRITITPP